MVKNLRRALSMSIASLLIGLYAGCGGTSRPRSDQDAKFDALVDFTRAEIVQQGVPGAAIAVILDGELKYEAGIGTKRIGADDPVHAGTVFGIASATKMLTAAGVLTLRDEGKVDLDAPVTDYVPYFQLAGADGVRTSSIHLRHLLSHSAGLPDGGPAVCTESLSGWFHDEGKRMPLWYEPGTLWDYSNPGYALAGLVLEEVSGRPFADAMQERLFGPLGMRSATFEAKVAMARDHSLGHVPDEQGNLQPLELDTIDCPASVPQGASTYATAGDMARFALALLAQGEPVLEPASVEEMQGQQMETHHFPGEGYGLGLFSFEYRGVRHLHHGGDVPELGFNSIVVLVPERRFAVVVLFNRDTGGSGLVAAKAVELFLGISPEETDWLTPPSTWAKYAGEYFEPFTFGRLNVTLENDSLMVEAVDLDPGGKREMSQLAEDYFLLDDPSLGQVPVTFWFEGDPTAAKYMVTRMGVAVRAP